MIWYIRHSSLKRCSVYIKHYSPRQKSLSAVRQVIYHPLSALAAALCILPARIFTGSRQTGQKPCLFKKKLFRGLYLPDTADYHVEDVSNRLFREALYPYYNDLVICTKMGAARDLDKSLIAYNRPAHLRLSIENNLRTLGIDQLKLVHLRVMPGSEVSFDESMAAMFEMQEEEKIQRVGLAMLTLKK